MKLIKSLLIIALSQISFTAYAGEGDFSDEFSACVEKSEGGTKAMLDCIAAETERQDGQLNKAYKEIMSELSPERKKRLQEAQRLWIKYRDANCDFYADPDDGTAATVSSSDCLMRMTAERAKELEGFKGELGSISSGETNNTAKAESSPQGGSKYVVKKFEREFGECTPSKDLDCASMSIRYPEIIESQSKAAKDSVNNFVKKSLLQWGDKNLESFQELANQFVEEYKSYQKELEPDHAFGWAVEREVEPIYNTRKILSLSIFEYAFTGGAHPNSFLVYASFNMSTGERIKLSDILIDGYEAELNRIAEVEFRGVRELKPDESLEEAGFWFEDNKFSLNDNFAVTEEGLIFYFNSYDIAPYAAGPTELILNYGEFKHLIRKNGLLTGGDKS